MLIALCASWQIMYMYTHNNNNIITYAMHVHVPEEAYGNLQQPRVMQKYSEQIRKLNCGVERFGHYLAMLTSILRRFSVQLASQQLEKLIQSKKEPWIARQ